MSLALNRLARKPPSETSAAKPKKKVDRFDGLSEEEVKKYTLEDILEPDLDIVFVGINPSLMAAHRGRYYAGPGNHFYKLLYESGLVPRFVGFEEDKKLLDYKIGLTNIVGRATRSSSDLKKSEIKIGSDIMREKLKAFKPRIAVFNGKCIYEVFAENTAKSEFRFGLRPERLDGTAVWVVPSSSARCAHFPRMVDKLHFYLALKKYLSYLRGEISEINEDEFRFEGKCKQSIATTSIMWRRKNPSAFLHGGRVANKNAVRLDTSDESIDGIERIKGNEFVVTEILGVDNADNADNADNDDNDDDADYARKADSVDATAQLSNAISPRNGVKSRRNRGNNFAAPRERTTEKMYPRHSFTLRNKRDPSTDFVDLIKKRLSVKKVDTVETRTEPARNAKKLKYANLRSRDGKINHKNSG